MARFGFHELWIDRMMHFITSVSYGFIQNGVEFGRVVPTCEVRQGDLISLYIYIMCAEGLSAMLRRNVEAGLIHGCILARGAQAYPIYFLQTTVIYFLRLRRQKQIVLNGSCKDMSPSRGNKLIWENPRLFSLLIRGRMIELRCALSWG